MDIGNIRAGVPELNFKEVDGTFIVKDVEIQLKYDESVIFLSDVSANIPKNVKDILTKYLAQHLILMNMKETTSLSLPNNSESWKARLNDLALDQTVPGQNFRALIRKYTDDFATSEEVANKKHHGLKFFS